MDGQRRTGTVVHIDARDLILLEIDPPVQVPDLEFSAPDIGKEYYLLGLSPSNNNLCASYGVVATTQISGAGHFFGASGSCPGGSGGGCFESKLPPRFLGMNVGNWTRPLTEKSPL